MSRLFFAVVALLFGLGVVSVDLSPSPMNGNGGVVLEHNGNGGVSL